MAGFWCKIMTLICFIKQIYIRVLHIFVRFMMKHSIFILHQNATFSIVFSKKILRGEGGYCPSPFCTVR
jgi:hypothetical protein